MGDKEDEELEGEEAVNWSSLGVRGRGGGEKGQGGL